MLLERMLLTAQAALSDGLLSVLSSSLGMVYYIGYVGECMERFKVKGVVHSLLLHNEGR